MVFAFRSKFSPSLAMVAVFAHAIGIVLLVSVNTFCNNFAVLLRDGTRAASFIIFTHINTDLRRFSSVVLLR